jgi:hypothetical protein
MNDREQGCGADDGKVVAGWDVSFVYVDNESGVTVYAESEKGAAWLRAHPDYWAWEGGGGEVDVRPGEVVNFLYLAQHDGIAVWLR